MLPWQPNLAKNKEKVYKNGDNFSCGVDINTDFGSENKFMLSKKTQLETQ